MDQLPGNSHRQQQSRQTEPPKMQRVVQGEVTVRKKPIARRLADTLFAGRADVVGASVFWDVLIPAAKNTIADMSSSYVERLMFGDSATGVRGRASSVRNITSMGGFAQSQQQVPYNRIGNPLPGQPVMMSRQGRARHDIKEILIPTRMEAQEVLDRLFNQILEFNAVTVADLYELCGVSPDYTDDKWGWTDIRSGGILRVRDGFVLDLPRPEPLD